MSYELTDDDHRRVIRVMLEDLRGVEMTTNAQVIISRIDTLCDQFGHGEHNRARRGRDEQILRLLAQAIADYFEVMKDEPPPDLGIKVSDDAALGDLFG